MLIRPATVADEASMRILWDEFAVEANYDPYPANPFERGGKGIARALMRAMAEELHAQRREYVLVNVDTPNAAARGLYEELGFVEIAQTLRLPTDQLLA